jgi:hypothetical protein
VEAKALEEVFWLATEVLEAVRPEVKTRRGRELLIRETPVAKVITVLTFRKRSNPVVAVALQRLALLRAVAAMA